MAFDPNIEFGGKCNCKDLSFRDITGAFEATNNPGGYDDGSHTSGNPAVDEVTVATATITFGDGRVSNTVDLLTAGLYPSVNGAWITLLGTSLGLGADEKIPDRLMKIEVHIIASVSGGSSIDETFTYYKYQHCQVDCCVKKMALKTKRGMDCCKDNELKQFIKAKAYVDALDFADGCCNWAECDEIYDRLKKLCSESGCANC